MYSLHCTHTHTHTRMRRTKVCPAVIPAEGQGSSTAGRAIVNVHPNACASPGQMLLSKNLCGGRFGQPEINKNKRHTLPLYLYIYIHVINAYIMWTCVESYRAPKRSTRHTHAANVTCNDDTYFRSIHSTLSPSHNPNRRETRLFLLTGSYGMQ